jgi:hypothetical protein
MPAAASWCSDPQPSKYDAFNWLPWQQPRRSLETELRIKGTERKLALGRFNKVAAAKDKHSLSVYFIK